MLKFRGVVLKILKAIRFRTKSSAEQYFKVHKDKSIKSTFQRMVRKWQGLTCNQELFQYSFSSHDYFWESTYIESCKKNTVDLCWCPLQKVLTRYLKNNRHKLYIYGNVMKRTIRKNLFRVTYDNKNER